MSICSSILVINIIIMGMYSSITDFENNKIYNKAIIISGLIGCIIQVITITYLINQQLLTKKGLIIYAVYLLIGIAIPFLAYINNLWAAGDSKLFTLFVILFPIKYVIEEKYFFSIQLNIFISIFSIAFIFIILETLFLLYRDFLKGELKNKVHIFQFNSFKLNNIKRFIWRYIFTYFFVRYLNKVFMLYIKEFYFDNRALFMLINIIIIFMLYNLIKNMKTIRVLAILMIAITTIFYIIFPKSMNNLYFSINLKLLLLIGVIIIFRYIGSIYNYKSIMVKELEEGMILSVSTVLLFQKSRVKGLPKTTTESTKSRLTVDEVKAILRWSKSKYGKETIIIVRHIPFAPFIFLGFLMQLTIKFLF